MPELATMDPEEKPAAAGQLNAERNRARAQVSQTGDPLRRIESSPGSGGKESGKYGSKMSEIDQKRQQGGKLNPAEKAAYAGKLKADRFKSKKQKEDKGKGEKGEEEKGDEYEVTMMRFLIFMVVGICQDLIPAIFDLVLAIGWLINYVMLPLTWFLYWYLIIRWVPKALKRKYWLRTALVTSVGLIPVMGEILPEWTATAIGAMIVYYRYKSTGGRSLADATATTKAVAGGEAK